MPWTQTISIVRSSRLHYAFRPQCPSSHQFSSIRGNSEDKNSHRDINTKEYNVQYLSRLPSSLSSKELLFYLRGWLAAHQIFVLLPVSACTPPPQPAACSASVPAPLVIGPPSCHSAALSLHPLRFLLASVGARGFGASSFPLFFG